MDVRDVPRVPRRDRGAAAAVERRRAARPHAAALLRDGRRRDRARSDRRRARADARARRRGDRRGRGRLLDLALAEPRRRVRQAGAEPRRDASRSSPSSPSRCASATAGYFEATWGPDFHVDEAATLAKHLGRPVSWAAIMANKRQPGEAVRTAERVLEQGGPVCPQIACRPIVVQIALSDPSPFATAAAFTEVLALPRERRGELYAEPEWRRRAPRATSRRSGARCSTRRSSPRAPRHAELIGGDDARRDGGRVGPVDAST